MLLTDTSTEEDIHINDCLVDEGHARFSVSVEEQEDVKEDQTADNTAYTAEMYPGYETAQDPSSEGFQDAQQAVGPNGDVSHRVRLKLCYMITNGKLTHALKGGFCDFYMLFFRFFT